MTFKNLQLQSHETRNQSIVTIGSGGTIPISTVNNTVQVNLSSGMAKAGTIAIIYDFRGNASTNNIDVHPLGGYSINGGTDIYITTDFGGAIVFHDGNNWFTP